MKAGKEQIHNSVTFRAGEIGTKRLVSILRVFPETISMAYLSFFPMIATQHPGQIRSDTSGNTLTAMETLLCQFALPLLASTSKNDSGQHTHTHNGKLANFPKTECCQACSHAYTEVLPCLFGL